MRLSLAKGRLGTRNCDEPYSDSGWRESTNLPGRAEARIVKRVYRSAGRSQVVLLTSATTTDVSSQPRFALSEGNRAHPESTEKAAARRTATAPPQPCAVRPCADARMALESDAL